MRQLGVIDELSLTFGPGMTAVTGETGAGKTLVVEAIELLVGGRADSQLVRPGRRGGPRRRALPPAGRRGGGDQPGRAPRRPLAGLPRRPAGLAERAGRAGRRARRPPRSARPPVAAAAGGPAPTRSTATPGSTTAPAEPRGPSCAASRPSWRPAGATRPAGPASWTSCASSSTSSKRPGWRTPARTSGWRPRRSCSATRWPTRRRPRPPTRALSDDGGASDALAGAIGALGDRAPFADLAERARALAAELADVAGELRGPGRGDRARPRAARLGAAPAPAAAGPAPQVRRPGARGPPTGAGRVAALLARAGVARRRARAAGAPTASGSPRWQAARDAAAERAGRRGAAGARRPPGGRARPGARRRTSSSPTWPCPGCASTSRWRGRRGTGPARATVTFLLAANPGAPLLPLAKVASGGELSRVMLALRLALDGGGGGRAGCARAGRPARRGRSAHDDLRRGRRRHRRPGGERGRRGAGPPGRRPPGAGRDPPGPGGGVGRRPGLRHQAPGRRRHVVAGQGAWRATSASSSWPACCRGRPSRPAPASTPPSCWAQGGGTATGDAHQRIAGRAGVAWRGPRGVA